MPGGQGARGLGGTCQPPCLPPLGPPGVSLPTSVLAPAPHTSPAPGDCHWGAGEGAVPAEAKDRHSWWAGPGGPRATPLPTPPMPEAEGVARAWEGGSGQPWGPRGYFEAPRAAGTGLKKEDKREMIPWLLGLPLPSPPPPPHAVFFFYSSCPCGSLGAQGGGC